MTSPGYEANKRWRHNNPDRRKAGRKRRKDRTAFAPNDHKEWTEAEQRMVLEHSIPDIELAAKLGRSEQAIQLKRVRIKRDGFTDGRNTGARDRAGKPAKAPQVCPGCHLALPATGVCDDC
jgi:hypothetical protein